MQIPFFRNKYKEVAERQTKQLTRLQNQLTLFQQTVTLQAGMQFINDNLPKYPDWDVQKQTEAYCTMDHVYAIVNKIAETTSLIPFYAYVQKPERIKAYKKYSTTTNRQFYTTKGIFDIQILQTKALEDAPEDDMLSVLLDQPNASQSKQEFFLALYIYYLLSGEAFIWKYRIPDGANRGTPSQLYLLPPENIILHVSKKYPFDVVRYEFVVQGERIAIILPDDIIHIKRFNPYNIAGRDFRGLSPLATAKKILTQLNNIDDISTAQLQNGGVPGVLFDETITHDEVNQDVLDEQRNKIYEFFTNTDNKGAPYVAAGKKGYLQMGLKLVDMQVLELQTKNFKRLCNIWKISDIVFNSDSAATESNVQQMVKQMYTNVCLPMAYGIRDKLNQKLSPDFKGMKRVVDIDITGITELQDDMKDLAIILATLPVTPSGDEMRSLFGFDATGNPNMQKQLVKAGYSFIDDLQVDMPPVGEDLLNIV